MLLLDEPFDGLDVEASELLVDWLKSLSGSHLVILIAHTLPQRLRVAEKESSDV